MGDAQAVQLVLTRFLRSASLAGSATWSPGVTRTHDGLLPPAEVPVPVCSWLAVRAAEVEVGPDGTTELPHSDGPTETGDSTLFVTGENDRREQLGKLRVKQLRGLGSGTSAAAGAPRRRLRRSHHRDDGLDRTRDRSEAVQGNGREAPGTAPRRREPRGVQRGRVSPRLKPDGDARYKPDGDDPRADPWADYLSEAAANQGLRDPRPRDPLNDLREPTRNGGRWDFSGGRPGAAPAFRPVSRPRCGALTWRRRRPTAASPTERSSA